MTPRGKLAGAEFALQRSSFASEAELQELLAASPDLLPIAEIDPRFAGAVAIGRESKTAVGPTDLLLLNGEGFLTLVETKLAKNPEQRREVIAQCLDYFATLPRRYEDYERFYRAFRGDPQASLYRAVFGGDEVPELDEEEFKAAVEANLDCGRVLIVVVGDQIRNARQLLRMVEPWNRAPGIEATFSLVGILPYEATTPGGPLRVYVPHLYGRTEIVERTIIQVRVQSQAGESLPVRIESVQSDRPRRAEGRVPSRAQSEDLSEQTFRASLEQNGLGEVWTRFFAELPGIDCEIVYRPSVVIVRAAVGGLSVPLLYVDPEGRTQLSNNAEKALRKLPEPPLNALRAYKSAFLSIFPQAVVNTNSGGLESLVAQGPGLLDKERELLAALERFLGEARREVGLSSPSLG